MKTTKKLFALIFAVVLSFSMLPTTNINAASKVKLSKTKTTIYVGKTVTLKLKNNKKKVKWTTSNKKIATVSKKGKVKGKKAGKVTITAKVRKKKYKCKITVKKKQTPKPTIKPTEQPTTKPAETPTTKPVEQPTDGVEEPSLNPQIAENVETLKKLNKTRQEQGADDKEILSKIDEINKSEIHDGLVSEKFNINKAVQAIINDTAQYSKYVDYHGGCYDEKYKTEEYSGVIEFNDNVIQYLEDGTEFEITTEPSCEYDGQLFKYCMFNNYEFNYSFDKTRVYKDLLSKYMQIGHPKIDSIDTFILETQPQRYYDEETNTTISHGIKYDNEYCSYVITFLSNQRIYNAYMSFAEVEDDDGNLSYQYRLLDLTAEPIEKDYIKTLDVNWDLMPDKWFTITEHYADNVDRKCSVQITDYKIEKAETEGYNRLSFTYTRKRGWSPTVDEILNMANSDYCEQTGKICGEIYFAIVDYDTGTCLEKENPFNVTVSDYDWEHSDYEKFTDENTGAWIRFARTTTCTVSLTYPKDYTNLCVAIGGNNRLSKTNSDANFFKDNIQFGTTSYYKNGKNNSHWMRVLQNTN